MITLHLQPDTEAELAAEAEERGLTLQRYVEKILEERGVVRAPRHDAAYQVLHNIAVEVDARDDIKKSLDDLAHGRSRQAHEDLDTHKGHDISR